jgi:hypothetical protein
MIIKKFLNVFIVPYHLSFRSFFLCHSELYEESLPLPVPIIDSLFLPYYYFP